MDFGFGSSSCSGVAGKLQAQDFPTADRQIRSRAARRHCQPRTPQCGYAVCVYVIRHISIKRLGCRFDGFPIARCSPSTAHTVASSGLSKDAENMEAPAGGPAPPGGRENVLPATRG